MANYTGNQFQPGTDVYYSFDVHGYWRNKFGNYIGGLSGTTFKRLTNAALDEWDDNLNFNFVYTPDAKNADLTINWALIDGPGRVLGFQTAYDPDSNGIVSGPNEGLSAIFMDIYDYRYFSTTIKHEIGHAVGLGHNDVPGSLMYPYIGGNLEITAQNILDASELYGYDTAGSNSAEVLAGSSKADNLAAYSGDDTVSGGSGDDTIWGGNGDDAIWGDDGTDHIFGQNDGDLIYGNNEIDVIDGGAGDDTIFGGQNSGTARTDAFGNLRQQDGIETISGNAGNDLIFGNFGDELISGGTGDDTIYGGQNNDTIYGGSGDDVIYGNKNDDVLFGEAGSDTFVFGAADQGADTIGDFNSSDGDHLSLVGDYTTSNSDGHLLITYDGGTILLYDVSPTAFDNIWLV